MRNKYLLFFAFITPIIYVLVAIGVSKKTPTQSNEYISYNLNKYIDEHLVNNNIFPSNINISVHRQPLIFDLPNMEKEIRNSFAGDFCGPANEIGILNGMDYINYIANLFVIGTEFEGKVRINSRPEEGYLNLYFLDQDDANLSTNFRNNCAFIGHYHAIVCDASFIKRVISDLDKIKNTYDIIIYGAEGRIDLSKNYELKTHIIDRLKGNVLTWILGHEIGHAVLHYESVVGASRNLHFNLVYNEKEKEADEFVAKTIVLSEGSAAEFKVLVTEFIHQEYRKQYKRSHRHLTIKELIEIEKRDFPLNYRLEIVQSRFQVPLLLRSLHIVNAILTLEPKLDESGYYSKIKNNISITQSTL